jgi:hypothetical protein
MNKIVENVLGQSNVELIKYMDSIHARLEKLNEQTDVVISLLKEKNNCCHSTANGQPSADSDSQTLEVSDSENQENIL